MPRQSGAQAAAGQLPHRGLANQKRGGSLRGPQHLARVVLAIAGGRAWNRAGLPAISEDEPCIPPLEFTRERMTSRANVFLLAASALSVLACTRATIGEKANRSALPIIERVVPAAGPAGTAYPLQVTIEGRHFADSANTVKFGPVAVNNLPSTEGGTRIVLFLPKEAPSKGEVPPAVLQPGTYRITVTTSAGESNSV